MEKRVLAKTGESLSVVGFGGIIVMDESPKQSVKLVAEAVERGINYFDVAPSYGNAEERLGPALQPYRKKVFLACKTEKRTAAEARSELERSLKRLRTDHFDLYQLHGLTNLDEVEMVCAADGALKAFKEARQQGKIRYIGFSAHSEEAALALLDRFEFASVLFPLSWACWYKEKFGQRLLKKAEEQGIGRLALKALAKRKWKEGEEKPWPKCWYAPVDDPQEAKLALRFTLSLPVTAAVSPSHAELLWWACDAAEDLSPLSPEEQTLLNNRAQAQDTIFPE